MRQAAEAMSAAAEQAATAKSAIIQSRSSRDWRSHVTDAHDMNLVTSQAARLVVNLIDHMQAAATSTRRQFLDTPAPGGREWPQTVVDAGREAAQRHNRVRHQLSRLHLREAYNAGALLHEALQDAARDANRQAR